MATVLAGLGGLTLTETYVMRKLHKEAVKKATKEEKSKTEMGCNNGGKDKKPSASGATGSGCFFWAFGKSRPAAKVSSLVLS
uniref:Uncharacterized protein n=1 Tax=Bruguiera gymnorhiza TaxID=39984 RepID=B1Q4T9_BRUGY|nr:hypothetical protein [Bruguiera gymnorhiza]